MTFPLPVGVCRKVCRPVRDPPRVVRVSAVVRMARAAVKHGAEPCEVVREVLQEVGCELCKEHIEGVRDGIEALVEAIADFLKALYDLIDALLGIRVQQLPPAEGDAVRIRTFWEKLLLLLRRALIVFRIKEAADALFELIDAWARLNEVLAQFMIEANALANCVEGFSDEQRERVDL